jgi:hypothetical protein
MLFPNLSIGTVTITKVFDEGASSRNLGSIRGTKMEPMINAGLEIGIKIIDNIFLITEISLGVIMEKKEIMLFSNLALMMKVYF